MVFGTSCRLGKFSKVKRTVRNKWTIAALEFEIDKLIVNKGRCGEK